jgi:hypothetical protein
LKTMLMVCIVLVLLGLGGLVYIQYIRNSIYGWTRIKRMEKPPATDISKEWYDLSWNTSAPDPLRVIALAEKMADSMDPFRAAMHMTTSFYSQVKYLVRQGKLPTAFAFFLESRKWRELSLQRRHSATGEKDLMAMEVLGAPDFKLAMKIPILGRIFFQESALKFLRAAEAGLDQVGIEEKKVNSGKDLSLNTFLSAAIIWSKLYALTGGKDYKTWVLENTHMKKQTDLNQVLRIANHLGFKTREELYAACAS